MSDEQAFLRTGHPIPALSGDFVGSVPFEVAEVLKPAVEWREAQKYAGHNELNAKLATLGQAVDRYARLL